ncbi:MAG: thioredoxin domain-containing protein [Chloroflexota bacterium]
MPNQLANQNSPYLLQHKDNPVDWYPWGEAALQKAKTENKPIFLSIGYAACHWCHVMERESFEDPATAALMNKDFINIKVDREERPDLDGIYMSAVVAITGQGGWPMSVFLTPDLEPFFGGTYFPPVPRHGMSSFSQVLNKIAEMWAEKADELVLSGQKLTEHLQSQKMGTQASSVPLTKDTLEAATLNLIQSYDWNNGGWGSAPKFPQPMSILFLLRQASLGDQQALKVSEHALNAMAKGGIYDLVGGGFARYSVDDHWLVPHFEKMLYDNAQLARAYLHAYLLTGEPYYRQITEQTLDFVLAELTHPQGGFFSSIDADSEGEEGKFYVWDIAELEKLLTDEERALLKETHEISSAGNFEGQIVLRRKTSGPITPEVNGKFEPIREKLFNARSTRTRPATDDKVLAAWNAWMSITFAEAGRYLGRQKYLHAAQNNLGFLLDNLIHNSRLLRSWREDQAQHTAYLEDYAGLILALLALYQSDYDNRWYQQAHRLTDQMIELFSDETGQFYDTAHDQPDLLLRPQEIQDNATPSGGSLAAQALLQLAAYTGEGRYHDLAVKLLSPLQEMLAGYPAAFGSWLAALDFALGDVKEIALLGDLGGEAGQALLSTINKRLQPNMILAASDFPPADSAPPLLQGRPLIESQTTAYLCQNFTCQQPTSDPDILQDQLGQTARHNHPQQKE